MVQMLLSLEDAEKVIVIRAVRSHGAGRGRVMPLGGLPCLEGMGGVQKCFPDKCCLLASPPEACYSGPFCSQRRDDPVLAYFSCTQPGPIASPWGRGLYSRVHSQAPVNWLSRHLLGVGRGWAGLRTCTRGSEEQGVEAGQRAPR